MICNMVYLSNPTSPVLLIGPVDATYSVLLLNGGGCAITSNPAATGGVGGDVAYLSNAAVTVVLHNGESLYGMGSGEISFVAVTTV